jgi:hypothetical protein
VHGVERQQVRGDGTVALELVDVDELDVFQILVAQPPYGSQFSGSLRQVADGPKRAM